MTTGAGAAHRDGTVNRDGRAPAGTGGGPGADPDLDAGTGPGTGTGTRVDAGTGTGIDRRALVGRHAVEIDAILPDSPLSVGNGELCYTVDVTGLQSLPDHYPVEDPTAAGPGTLLATMAQWGWHSLPGAGGAARRSAAVAGSDRTGRDAYDLADTRRAYRTPRGPVEYVDLHGDLGPGGTETGTSAAEAWLRTNPHRLDLARIGLVWAGDGVDPGPVRPLDPAELSGTRQRLDLWTGVITSRFRLRGTPVRVTTACHPRRDVLLIRVESPLLGAGLAIRFAFPYGSAAWANAADWSRPEAHRSVLRRTARGARVARTLDATRYDVRIDATPAGTVRRIGAHELLVTSDWHALDLVVAFDDPLADAPASAEALAPEDAPAPEEALPAPGEVLAATRAHWAAFWRGGGAVELADSRDERAPELERRIVLSAYLTAIHCAGRYPPAETGLLVNSWRGRFHLEMHWWHAAHFPLWGRGELLERSLGWYTRILPVARETARRQGYAGARWPKQVAPDGRESPSPIGPFLIWQQPHPIYLAELVRRTTDSATALRRHAELVFASAEFMADFAVPGPRGHQLGPPLVPAQESYADRRAGLTNPTFELAYWAWALRVAARWRAALGLPPEPAWERVATGLARPLVRDGGYAAIDVAPYTLRDDHPSMLYALGVVPPTGLIDPEVMRATLRQVQADWDWASTWGWDYPAMAMTAVRLGEPATALDLLLMPTAKNTYLPNGHNRQSARLPSYLPGNGGLLTAVALMARGSDADVAAGRTTPGFPADGGWTVRHEGLHPLP